MLAGLYFNKELNKISANKNLRVVWVAVGVFGHVVKIKELLAQIEVLLLVWPLRHPLYRLFTAGCNRKMFLPLIAGVVQKLGLFFLKGKAFGFL